MRRTLLALVAALLGLVGLLAAACTAFDFPAPGGAASDGGGDEMATEGGAPAGYLDTADAARLCAQLFRCPRLAEAIALSIALPVDTPSSPLGFSACMDWVDGPIDPLRIGLAGQRALLAAVAGAASCDAAAAALPVRPVDAGSACGFTCADSTDLETCTPEGGSFVVPCSPPLFGQAGACFGGDAGTALCVSTGACTAGSSCTDPATLVQCLAGGATFISYGCSLSGRQCASLGTDLADCVIPGHSAAPCPLHEARDACDGTSVLHCAGGVSAQTELDCSAVGRTCSTANTAGAARCVGPSDACTPFDANQNVCAGSQISVCIGGLASSYDCAGIGLTCAPAGATETAHCG